MKRRKVAPVASRFNTVNLHDDILLSITIRPPRTAKNHTRIDIEFRDYSSDKKKLLSFFGCANIRYVMDFDVMADNWHAQTKASVAETDAIKMENFVRSQVAHWRVRYMPPHPKDKPVKLKMATIKSYVLFKVAFFGGTIEVLAKKYELKHTG